MKNTIAVTVILTALLLAVSWKVYAYKECKRIGHKTLYCILSSGK